METIWPLWAIAFVLAVTGNSRNRHHLVRAALVASREG